MFTENSQRDTLYRGYTPEFAKRARQRRKEAANRLLLQRQQDERRETASRKAARRIAKIAASIEPDLSAEQAMVTSEPLTVKGIIAAVALEHRVGFGDIMGHSRKRTITAARHAAIRAVADARPAFSLTAIGRVFGRDHTTILSSLQKTKKPGQAR